MTRETQGRFVIDVSLPGDEVGPSFAKGVVRQGKTNILQQASEELNARQLIPWWIYRIKAVKLLG